MDNIIQMVVNALAILVTVGVYYVYHYQIKPWLVQNNLVKAAEVAVYAAEALYGRYNGAEKFQYAMKALSDKGWNIDSQSVLDAVNAAWMHLNNEQIGAGVKDAEKSKDSMDETSI